MPGEVVMDQKPGMIHAIKAAAVAGVLGLMVWGIALYIAALILKAMGVLQ